MKHLLTKLNRLVKQILGFLPSPLPVGVAEFESWVSSIENTYDLPTSDKDSVRFTLSTAIMHLDSGKVIYSAFKPKYYFVCLVRVAAAKQIAGSVMYDIKEKHKAAQLEAAKQLEATKNNEVASNESQKQSV